MQKHRRYLHNAMKKDKKERYKLKVRCTFFAVKRSECKDNKINAIVLVVDVEQEIVNKI